MKKPNSKSEDGKKFVKIGTEINEMESKRTIEKNQWNKNLIL
jgi:hypothetical protein